MKKYILILAVLFGILPLISQSQSKSDKMYDIFEDRDGVTNFSFSKNMLDVVNLDLGDEGDEKKVTGDLHQIRFMSYNPKKGDMSGAEFVKKAIGYLPKSSYKKFEDEDDEVNDAEIWLLGGKKKYKECHMFFNNEKDDNIRFVVSFYGDFKVNDLEGLTKMGKGMSD